MMHEIRKMILHSHMMQEACWNQG